MKPHDSNTNELADEAVDACINSWKALRQDGNINASAEYTNFMTSLDEKITKGELSRPDARIPSLLCVIASLSTNEELTDLEAIIETINVSLDTIDKCLFNDDEKAALRAIIVDVMGRNFPADLADLTVLPSASSYESARLRPYVRRYIEGYRAIRMGAA